MIFELNKIWSFKTDGLLREASNIINQSLLSTHHQGMYFANIINQSLLSTHHQGMYFANIINQSLLSTHHQGIS